ncbi:MAG: glycoside hydrolase family 125 protein, partial [Actinomycetes bacterium]
SDLPYLLSSQLLLVYVARRLAQWEAELGLQDLSLADDADRTWDQIGATFTCTGPHGLQWAYETDGHRHRLYQDANDVPTALAPLWGLCAADDPSWRGTMQFAFSSENPGFVDGHHGGLGSAHTPGVWSLGVAQEWASAVATSDLQSAERALDRLRLVVSDDGMLPETYQPDTGDWLARHWFAWPGALLGVLNRSIRARSGPWLEDVSQ